MKRNNVLVAITGGIGSGKSCALNLVKELGYPAFSCDEEVSALYKKRRVLSKLKKEFPTAINGKLFLSADKREIAKICFENEDKLAFLEKTLAFPALKSALKKAGKVKGIAFVEVPLLFECKAEGFFDKVIVITRDKTTRIESVKARSNLTEDEIAKRISRQIDYDAFDFKSAIVIENDGSTEDLKEKLKQAIEKI